MTELEVILSDLRKHTHRTPKSNFFCHRLFMNESIVSEIGNKNGELQLVRLK